MTKSSIEILDQSKTRCAVCKIRSYSFCRCLPEEQLNIFSNISEDKHRIIFDGEKKYGRIIYINKDKDILYGRFINNNDKVKKILGFDLKWKKG